MTGSIWTPGGTILSTANADNSYKAQRFTATAGQTVFTLTAFAYAIGTGSLLVFINGVDQFITTDFTETDSTHVTLVTAAEAGDIVVIRGLIGGTGAQAAEVSATASAASATASAASAASSLASYNNILALSLPNLPLSIANGGTGQNTKAAAFIALAPAPEAGKVIGSSDGANFTMVTPASNFIPLAELTPSSSSAYVNALTIFSSTYDNYLIVGVGINSQSAARLVARFAVAGSIDASNNYATQAYTNTTGSLVSEHIIHTSNSNPAELGRNFELWVRNVNSTSTGKSMHSVCETEKNVDLTWGFYNRGCYYNNAAAVTGISFNWYEGSNFKAEGKIRIYGIRNS